MHDKKQYLTGIRTENPDFFLFSGGGNDILKLDYLSCLIKAYDPKKKLNDHFNNNLLLQTVNQLTNYLKEIIIGCQEQSEDLIIIYHAYDFPRLMQDSKYYNFIVKEQGHSVESAENFIKLILLTINEKYEELKNDMNDNVIFLKCLNVIGREDDMWHDEIHPSKKAQK